MNKLIKTYGVWMTGLFTLFTAIWIVVFIVLPQLTVIERAFVFVDKGGALAQVGNDIDLIYAELSVVEFDIGEVKNAGGLSSSTPSPSFGLSAGVSAPQLTPLERQDKLLKLQSYKTSLFEKLQTLEAQEKALKVEKTTEAKYSFKNFTSMSELHVNIFLWTLFYSLCVTLLAFFVCYPVAFAVSQASTAERGALMMLGLIIPYAINELLRIFAWILILSKQGVINSFLASIGIVDMAMDGGFQFLASNGAVFTVMVYAYILFMVFPIYNTIETLDKNLIEAAKDLGSAAWRIHWRVILPHAKPGIAVGCVMTFMLSIGSIAVPETVGRGLHPDWFSQVIYRRFFESNEWNQGSAYSLVLLLACILFIFTIMRVFKVGIREISR